HGESSPDAQLAGHFDAPALGLDDGFADGQTQTEMAVGARARFVRAVESIKDMRQMLCGYALARIGDDQNSGAILRASADANGAVGPVVADGIGEEVGEDLADAVGAAEGWG